MRVDGANVTQVGKVYLFIHTRYVRTRYGYNEKINYELKIYGYVNDNSVYRFRKFLITNVALIFSKTYR